MKAQIKSLLSGFTVAVVLFLGIIVCLFYLAGKETRPFRDQVLHNGKTVKVTSFYLVWGVDHDPEDRDPTKDSFQLEYVTSSPDANQQIRDQECWEVFELIRPVSELWGFDHASVHAFPTTQRKGRYDIYAFKRDPAGSWSFDRHPAKVYAND
jgi:hypothetical protein